MGQTGNDSMFEVSVILNFKSRFSRLSRSARYFLDGGVVFCFGLFCPVVWLPSCF
jgi:hypothetical protein